MSMHSTVHAAVMASMTLGDDHGDHWKNWLEVDLGHSHRKNESFRGPSWDEMKWYECERQRRDGCNPIDRELFNDVRPEARHGQGR